MLSSPNINAFIIFQMQAYIESGQKVFLDPIYDLSINTLGDSKEHACNSSVNYTYDGELYGVIAQENAKQTNCSVPFPPQTKSKVTGETIEICNSLESGKIAYSNWIKCIQRYRKHQITLLVQECIFFLAFHTLIRSPNPVINSFLHCTSIYM